ncbi:MAG TPA: hypothetical protein VM734_00265 [Kofleriaceae bacterium]|jgi:hypothetical protein|nr:hypothetical protein [Kofleriaceae bacterium]
MPRSVHQILGLLGTKDPAAVRVYPLAGTGDDDPDVDAHARSRVVAWASVWGADFGRLTASVTAAEKDALIAAGAREASSARS